MSHGNCFDEEPDAPLHGECAAEIHRLEAQVAILREALNEILELTYDDMAHGFANSALAATIPVVKETS